MAIFVPGIRGRGGRFSGGGRRSAVIVLNMTAMVDMFTVMCVFLLQNYATTNQVLPLPDKVNLPGAHEVKELKPSNVVIIGQTDGVMLNNFKVAEYRAVKEQEAWEIQMLIDKLKEQVEAGKKKDKSVGSQIKNAVNNAKKKDGKPEEEEVPDYMKITIQADKDIEFLTIKKVMYSVTEAGMREINFAVMKKEDGKAKAL